MPERESIANAIVVSTSVALACSLIVSAAVSWLRPIQLAHRLAGRDVSVLIAAGLASEADELDDDQIVDRLLELQPRLVDLDAGRFVNADSSMVVAYDYRLAADDPAASRPIDSAIDFASLGRRPLLMPVYLRYAGGDVDRVVLTLYGSGMWSTIHAYLTLDGNLTRVVNFHIAEQGETPGIGDRIENADWLASWSGKRAFLDDGTPVLRVGGSVERAPDEKIDGITGATVTVTALDGIVRYWLGEDAYGPFLAALRQEISR